MAPLRVSLLRLAIGMSLFWIQASTYPLSDVNEELHTSAGKGPPYGHLSVPGTYSASTIEASNRALPIRQMTTIMSREAKEESNGRSTATGAPEPMGVATTQDMRTAFMKRRTSFQARDFNLNNIIHPPPPPPPPPDNHPKDASDEIAIPDAVCEARDSTCIDQTRKEWVKSIAEGGTLNVDATPEGIMATAVTQEAGDRAGSSDSVEDLEWEDHKNEGPDAGWAGDSSE